MIVGADLTVEGADNIFVVGDTASSDAWNGNPVPGLASAAKQGGAYAASVIAAKLSGKRAQGRSSTNMADHWRPLAGQQAVADFGWIKLSGAPAWWLWSVVHVLFLSSARSRFAVAMEWAGLPDLPAQHAADHRGLAYLPSTARSFRRLIIAPFRAARAAPRASEQPIMVSAIMKGSRK